MMNPEQWRAVGPYLEQALEMSAEERAAWLRSLRAQDSSMAALLETLLEEHRLLEEEHFLEQSPFPPSGPDVLSGQSVGAYKLISSIGQGGMGSVWLAERSDGRFQRHVAVKFLNSALMAGGSAERFKREGSILGRLSHPRIADLMDAGVTLTGQPYLILEYIEGQHIDLYCDQRRLDVDARIHLFLDVLSAVAHAHANLIVHRDIKPSNVLVRSDCQVKLLDFGIAKLLTADAETTRLTLEVGGALTLQFAAPEQITNGVITTATDVYALGLLLYVLLTGQHPAGPGPHSTADLVQSIVNGEPARPSAVITSVDDDSIAQNRSRTPDKLRRQLRGDLDTIIVKALKKNSAERYASVQAMADDLQRYLKHEPISARPDALAYRTAKFVRRNRTAVALATVALVAVIAGVTGTLIQGQTARRQRDLAFRERDRANRITDFMTGMFKVSDPRENVANRVTAREILDKASKDINTGLAKDPELQAQMMHVMGIVYTNLGLYNEAQSLLERAVQVGRTAGGPTDPEALRSMDDLGVVAMQQGRPGEAEKLQREALDLQRRILGPEHLDTLVTMADLAATLSEEGRLDEAINLCRQALEKERRLLGLEDRRTVAAGDSLAAMLGLSGRFAESEQLERETLAVEQRVYGPDYLGTLNSMSNLADTLYYMRRYAEAGQLWRQTLDIQRRVLGPDHPETARSTYNLGCLAARDGKRDEAFSLLGQAIDHLSPRTVPKLENDSELNPLRADPRFDTLVARARRRGVSDARCPL